MDKNIAQKAAKWWANQLRGTAKLDNGDPSNAGGMALMLATLLQADEKADQNNEHIDAFEQELTIILEREKDDYFHLGVDYHPDHVLQEAATKAELNLGMTSLPWKTTMWIMSGEIKVSEGYGAESVAI